MHRYPQPQVTCAGHVVVNLISSTIHCMINVLWADGIQVDEPNVLLNCFCQSYIETSEESSGAYVYERSFIPHQQTSGELVKSISCFE